MGTLALMDRVASFLTEKTPRRFMAVAAFLVVLYLFADLAVLLVFFVTFERALGFLSRQLAARTKLTPKKSLLVIVGLFVALLGVLGWLGVGSTVRAVARVHTSFPNRLAELRENPLVIRAHEQFGGTERIVKSIEGYSHEAMGAAAAVGHLFVFVLIGFILALVYSLEREEIREWWERIDRRSMSGTIGRWMGHLADSVVVTVQLQLVVAAFNTITTLPVLLLLGVPHVGALMLLVFVAALIPVVGNVVSGAVLALLAYQQQGWLGVGIFAGLTFILHKIEAYYLSPRLTARHVKMPGFVLIVSLLLCEHKFGFKGLFLSFPILFVAGRIRSEWLEEDAITTSASSSLVLSDSPDQLPDAKTAGPASLPTGIELETDE